ncbi:uncharacterized protein TNCV_2104281 [Trichonephila clavipes]|nr:uncharacterized protein TNCV_2104281 [Trichonephila clavipes]
MVETRWSSSAVQRSHRMNVPLLMHNFYANAVHRPTWTVPMLRLRIHEQYKQILPFERGSRRSRFALQKEKSYPYESEFDRGRITNHIQRPPVTNTREGRHVFRSTLQDRTATSRTLSREVGLFAERRGAHVTTLEEDFKQQPLCQDSPKDVLSDSGLEIELAIPFVPNRDPPDTPQQSQLGEVVHYHPSE